MFCRYFNFLINICTKNENFKHFSVNGIIGNKVGSYDGEPFAWMSRYVPSSGPHLLGPRIPRPRIFYPTQHVQSSPNNTSSIIIRFEDARSWQTRCEVSICLVILHFPPTAVIIVGPSNNNNNPKYCRFRLKPRVSTLVRTIKNWSGPSHIWYKEFEFVGQARSKHSSKLDSSNFFMYKSEIWNV